MTVTATANPPRPEPAIDTRNPWMGLASFTEETRDLFYGRDDEIAELARRVQRKLLTVLFGQSGLGKTSILQAGLGPKLRPEGYFPVHVRVDHSAEAPPPGEQIKAEVQRAAASAGTWSEPGAAAPGESLWEFFHHRDNVLVDAQGQRLTPLLIFDQFEEIFTLAQTDEAGRARARAFLGELADLVENRAPAAIEDRDETALRFDFARADYRVLIALREDYLAHLEGLRELMPSLAQNRMRLTRMAGGPALEAVLKPGAGLVSDEVARQIVRFVSGAQDLAAAEVEPSLLSLVCRELNEVRLARGEPTISTDLLEGSRDTILREFYERSLAGLPDGVRRFIEDELLTDSGYRESLAEERARKACADAGAPGALAALIDSRLLRVEERLDVRRVELTHDVLCGVVKASRDLRREREAREAAQRELAATRAREAAARRALWQARVIATGCAVLAVVAIGSAVFGSWNLHRALQAQTRAEEAEASARQRAYASDMNVALQELHSGNLGRAQDLLNRQRPRLGESDLRGWEWRYLWEQTRSDALAVLGDKESEIAALSVSPDGRWLAAGLRFNGGIFVWDLTTRKETAHLAAGQQSIVAVFSPAEPLLAYASREATGADRVVHLWNAATAREVGRLALNGACAGLAFSRDGRTLVTSTAASQAGGGTIAFWRVSDGTELRSVPSKHIPFGVANDFVVNGDLSLAAYGSLAARPERLIVVSLRDGRELWSAADWENFLTALAFSPDGRTLATAAGFGEKDIRLWDAASGKPIGRLEGHGSWVGSIAFWPDGSRLASASADQTIRVWDLASRTCVDVLRGHRSEVWRVALLPDGRSLVSGGKDGMVALWDTSVPHPHREHITLPEDFSFWRFVDGGRSILTLNRQGEVARWSGPDFQKKAVILKTGDDALRGFRRRFSPDGSLLAVGSNDGDLAVWDVAKGKLVRRAKMADGLVIPVAFTRSGRKLVGFRTSNARFFQWNLETGKEIQSWPASRDSSAQALSPDDRFFLDVNYSGGASLRDLEARTGTDLDLRGFEWVAAAFSPAGDHFAMASHLSYAKVWNTNDWSVEATLRGYFNAVHSVAFSPDGRRLATGAGAANEALKLWTTDRWEDVLTLGAEGSVFQDLAFSPDGNAIGVAESSGRLHVWRAPSWDEIRAAESAAPAPGGATDAPAGTPKKRAHP